MRQPFEGVETGEPDDGLVVPELISGFGVQLSDPALRGIPIGVHQGQLGGALTASGQQKRRRAAGADHESPSRADRVQLHTGTGAAIAPQQHGPGCRADSEHDDGTNRDRPVR
jgi:hypothetical protein